MRTLAFTICLFTCYAGIPLAGEMPTASYTIETIKTPDGVVPEAGALAFADDGTLWVCFRHGEVYRMPAGTREWHRFAEGLHDPLGIAPDGPDAVYVVHRPELTRIADTNGDGRADVYQKICDAWGMTGNYHELTFGLPRDGDGNFMVALGCASPNDGVREPLRGEFSAEGRKGKMYSAVPWRGWVLQVSPEGKVTPFASGFRTPNGLGYNCEGDLFVTDNQGDWVGTSSLSHAAGGDFHGHPSSLVWEPTFEGNPQDTPVDELNALRKRAAVLFPHGDMANSPTAPICDTTDGAFGPFAGQLIVAEYGLPRLIRVMLEKVGGEYQGACVPFIDGSGLKKGNNRMDFAPDGSLWIAQTMRGWGGPDEGIQRIVYAGHPPMDVLTMKLTKKGFELTFTKPADPETLKNPAAYSFQHYHYHYHLTYGSPKVDVTPVQVTNIEISDDKKTVRLELPELVKEKVYELNLRGIKSAKGEPLVNELLAYTLNRKLDQ